MKPEEIDGVWVFIGMGSQFPAAVFRSLEIAKQWIAKYKLTGCLTKYPFDVGIYDLGNRTELVASQRPVPADADVHWQLLISIFTAPSFRRRHLERLESLI